jgi:hypothetical protein
MLRPSLNLFWPGHLDCGQPIDRDNDRKQNVPSHAYGQEAEDQPWIIPPPKIMMQDKQYCKKDPE